MTHKQIHKAMKRTAALVLCAVLLYACVPVGYAEVYGPVLPWYVLGKAMEIDTSKDPYQGTGDRHTYVVTEPGVYWEDTLGYWNNHYFRTYLTKNGMMAFEVNYNVGNNPIKSEDYGFVPGYVLITIWDEQPKQIYDVYRKSDLIVKIVGVTMDDNGNYIEQAGKGITTFITTLESIKYMKETNEEPQMPYVWLPDYLETMDEIGENAMPGEADPRREYQLIKTEGASKEHNIVHTILAHYGDEYPFYYYANQYDGGDYIVLSKDVWKTQFQPMTISRYGFHNTLQMTIEPYYIIQQSRNNLILRVNENTITEYRTYTNNPEGKLKLAVPADAERLSRHQHVYFSGSVQR